ncbi:IQ domain-containing protein M isoform X13 [Panthera tigris]|uniref:IQ domain-containing protein M isoform X13 n=1 Tax=Panthera tigris TaxID=9694 RepID=UPI001C6F7459|nr:IQ domain-containing protein M isoform X13 [Panthera tigris]
MSDKEEGPILEIAKQDFFQEAKTLIAQHYEKVNENKVQSTSINVFRNKHQKPKSVKFIPLEIKKKETLDGVQELWTAHKKICFPKHLFKREHFEETPQQTSFKEPCMFSVKEKFKDSMDLIVKDKTFYDWRGIMSTKPSCLTPDSSWPSLCGPSSMFRDYHSKTLLKKEQQPIQPEPKPPRSKSILTKSGKLDNKVKRIGPHIEIFQVFRERNTFINTKKIVKMITIMQAYVRGWLERRRYQRIMIKALHHGPNLRAVINMYHRLIHRVKYRLGLWRTRQVINFVELEEWMDRKKFYETMFAKREDWQGLERSELLKFFNECGHFPIQQQIDEVWDLVHKEDRDRYSQLLKKYNAIEMLFTLYPPQGAHVCKNIRLRSTWLRPIVNGEEGYKYIGLFNIAPEEKKIWNDEAEDNKAVFIQHTKKGSLQHARLFSYGGEEVCRCCCCLILLWLPD